MNTPKTHNATQPNTAYNSRADYERERDARESAGMEKFVTSLFAAKMAASSTIMEPSPVESFAQVTAYTEACGSPADCVQGSEPTNAIAVDVELARVAVGLKKAHLFRVWMLLEEHARTTGRNYVLKADLPVLLQSHGVVCSDRNLSRWLNKGHDLFWISTPSRIRLIGYNAVSKSLSLLARATGLRDLVATNHPGQRRSMYVNVASDKLAEFEAEIYAAWLASRNNPTIARSTLKSLFNRDLNVLREWEQLAGIEIIENFGHYTTEHNADVPTDENGELRADVHQYRVDGQTRWKVQLSNTYVVPQAIRQHPKRGQGRRVNREVLEVLESSNPTGNCEQDVSVEFNKSVGGLEPLGRRYFTDSPKTTASAKAQDHADHHGIAPRFLVLGNIKHGQRQLVYAPDGKQRATAIECQVKHGRGVHFG